MGGGAARAQSLNYSPDLAVDVLFAIARLDEAALRLECGDVGSCELFRNLGKRRATGGEPLDQPLVDRLAFAIAAPADRRAGRAGSGR